MADQPATLRPVALSPSFRAPICIHRRPDHLDRLHSRGLAAGGRENPDVAQITAALIVLGGTMGAVMVTTPLRCSSGDTETEQRVR